MQDILMIENVDVRRADDPDDSRVLTITKMALPNLERKSTEHTPGGGVGSVEFLLPMLNAISPTFSVKGLDKDTLKGFGFMAGSYDKWTFAGAVRNTRLNKIIPVRATIRGVIASWTPGDNTPGEIADCDHALKEVTYYDLVLDKEELFAWGFYERIGRSGGNDWFGPTRIALGA